MSPALRVSSEKQLYKQRDALTILAWGNIIFCLKSTGDCHTILILYNLKRNIVVQHNKGIIVPPLLSIPCSGYIIFRSKTFFADWVRVLFYSGENSICVPTSQPWITFMAIFLEKADFIIFLPMQNPRTFYPAKYTHYTIFSPIQGLSGLAGGSSVSQLVADHMSFSDPKLGVVTDVTPPTAVVDLDPSRGIRGGGSSRAR